MISQRLILPDYLRGIASIGVLAFHFSEHTDFFLNFKFISHGYYWVDLFFILSGFLLTSKYSNLTTSSFSFIKKRIIRTWPLLFFSTSIIYIGQLYFNRLLYSEELLFSYIDHVLYLNSSFIGGIYPFGNTIVWSISAEMFAYIIASVIFKFNLKRQKLTWVITMLVCLFVLIYFGFTQELRYGFVRGVFGFSLGAIAFYYRDLLKIRVTFLLFIIISIILFQTVELVLGPFLLILFWFLFIKDVFKITNNNSKKNFILNYIGTRSFSIYVNHPILVYLVMKLNYSLILCFISIVIWIIYNEMVFRLIERKNYLKHFHNLKKIFL